jgi:hypothetical protein
MVITFEKFETPPKRKYVRKSKQQIESNIIENESNIIDTLDQEIKEKDLHLNQEMKRLKISESIQEDVKEVKEVKENKYKVNSSSLTSSFHIKSIDTYEFLEPINIYLYYSVTPIGKDIYKYVYFTNIYNPTGYITLPTFQPKNDSSNYEEQKVSLSQNVILNIRKFYHNKQEITWKSCYDEKSNKRKLSTDEWDYDFCQIKAKWLDKEWIDQNKYIFTYENKYFSPNYKLYM